MLFSSEVWLFWQHSIKNQNHISTFKFKNPQWHVWKQRDSNKYNEKRIINIIILIKWILRKALLFPSQSPIHGFGSGVQAAEKSKKKHESEKSCGNGENTSNYIENMIILCRFFLLSLHKTFLPLHHKPHMLSWNGESNAPWIWLGWGHVS